MKYIYIYKKVENKIIRKKKREEEEWECGVQGQWGRGVWVVWFSFLFFFIYIQEKRKVFRSEGNWIFFLFNLRGKKVHFQVKKKKKKKKKKKIKRRIMKMKERRKVNGSKHRG